MSPRFRVLVVTVVHVPLDTRIHTRQIGALVDAGVDVTYVAPWSGYGIDPGEVRDGVRALDVPRSAGRDRRGAVTAARWLIRAEAPDHDLVLIHDPELLLAVGGVRTPVVWDVHEDTAAALVDRPWVPRWARPAVAGLVHAAERWAERRFHLILAEEGYRDRFRRTHPVVPNYPPVPDEPLSPPDAPRAVYVGRLSRLRGAEELVALGRRLSGTLTVELVGPADDDVAPLLDAANRGGEVVWHGYLPNPEARRRIAGAAVGLSLLHDVPNYRHSLPTKVLEYLAYGVPVVTTPLPLASRIVEEADGGRVVGFGDVGAAEAAVRELWADPDARSAAGARGRALVAGRYSWDAAAAAFVAALERWARP